MHLKKKKGVLSNIDKEIKKNTAKKWDRVKWMIRGRNHSGGFYPKKESKLKQGGDGEQKIFEKRKIKLGSRYNKGERSLELLGTINTV